LEAYNEKKYEENIQQEVVEVFGFTRTGDRTWSLEKELIIKI